ncbi:glycoside hydrolase family 5 protein [Gorillibacterium sp. sgz5001074]|uniref:glycoside hydrolase family 5 protein n=1 Tax=Gorillibacterium sp. sgz5001074 TaxID=3446695 RepID=UPI003F67440A
MQQTYGIEREREVTEFVRADGRRLVNGEGREILLRGVGFGNWLLPEGYMWMFPKEGDRPRRIEAMIEGLIGWEKAGRFWELYYERYISEADIERIAAEGFNSVRVPINARFLMEDMEEPLKLMDRHLAYIDRMIGWCRDHRLYVILDLHGAPGGQTGTNIDDSERDHPDLYADEKYERLTVRLWRALAERYREEWIVAGYDLLNEPLPDWFAAYNGRLMPLYKEIVAAIREVDTRHMIILEGAHWATDWSVFTERIDDNLMLQFHKYWSNPDTESLQPYLEKRDEWNVPIFMGEGGENCNDWYAGAFQLFEDHRISWNFWPWKKLDTRNSPCSIRMPDDWQRLVRYLEGGDRPDQADAERILKQFVNALPLERCEYHPGVVRSLFRRVPFRVPAIFYGYKGEGISYVLGAAEPKENPWGFRIRDGADIRAAEAGEKRPAVWHGRGDSDRMLIVQLAEGAWFDYAFTLPTSRLPHKLILRMRACSVEGPAEVRVVVNGWEAGSVELSGGADQWQEAELVLAASYEAGPLKVRIGTKRQAVRLEWVEVVFSDV